MISVRDLTDNELLEQIKNAKEDLESAQYGTGDYNVAIAELRVALQEKRRRKGDNCGK